MKLTIIEYKIKEYQCLNITDLNMYALTAFYTATELRWMNGENSIRGYDNEALIFEADVVSCGESVFKIKGIMWAYHTREGYIHGSWKEKDGVEE